MTIDKAIKHLEEHLRYQQYKLQGEHEQSVALGIEALKREKRNRDDPNYVLVGPLPGESLK